MIGIKGMTRAAIYGTLLALAIVLASMAAPAARGSGLDERQEAVAANLSNIGAASEPGTAEQRTLRAKRKAPTMPVWRARNNTRQIAEAIYFDPSFSWTDYGVGRCQRANRVTVDCYAWVSEEIYSDGYYFDTMVCDWITRSWFQRSGRMQVRNLAIECFWLSTA